MAEPTYYDMPLTGSEIETALGKAETAWQDTDVPDLAALDHGGNARGTDAVNLQSRRTSAAQVASGYESVAVGAHSTASGSYSLAAGSGAAATGQQSTALGRNATAGTNSVAAGLNANASGLRAVALNGRALAPDSIAIGNGIEATSPNSIVTWGYSVIPRDNWNDQYERASAGNRVAFCTPYVDLGVPDAWAGETPYKNGDVVQPTAGGTVQYRAYTPGDDATGQRIVIPSGATEPIWPTAGGGVKINAAHNGWWIGIDWGAGYLTDMIPDYLTFFPTELAFICHAHSTLTGTPNISIGTAATPGLLVDADDVTIAGAPQIFRFTLANPSAGIPSGTAIQIKVHAFASAGRCVGRFLLSGFFVENPTNAV